MSGIMIYLYTNRSYIRNKLNSFKLAAYEYNNTLENRLPYRLFQPTKKKTGEYPLILYLHGGGERGTDNLKQLDGIVSFLTSTKIQRKHPSFVLAPQCQPGRQWLNTIFLRTPYGHYVQNDIPESDEMKMIVNTIHQLCHEYPIDKNKIYVLGYSMGSSGTWDIVTRYPDLFAAAIPISGVSDTTIADKIVHIPIWAFHGEEDSIAPVRLNQEMQSAINNAGGNCKLTTFPGIAHGCVYNALHCPGLVDWLFSQHK
jgi:predicted peptidase